MGGWGKVLGAASGFLGFVPGGQIFAGVLGAVATAVQTPQGVRYLSPYVDATIPAPFGFPSKPAALTLRVAEPLKPSVPGVAPKPKVRALFRLDGSERNPFAPPPGKSNFAGLIRAHAPALAAHPQYLGATLNKWTTGEGWVARVARLRAGVQLDADGFDPSWAFWDDPPTLTLGADIYGAKLFPSTLPSVEDFAPKAAHLGVFGGETPQNLLGLPYEKLADHVERNLKRARELVTQKEAELWEEIQAQAEFEAHVDALSEQYRAHAEAALANGLALIPFDQFLSGAQPEQAPVVGDAEEVVKLKPRRQSVAAVEPERAGGALVVGGLALLAMWL